MYLIIKIHGIELQGQEEVHSMHAYLQAYVTTTVSYLHICSRALKFVNTVTTPPQMLSLSSFYYIESVYQLGH